MKQVETFFDSIPKNAKILIVDLGLLGDTVHLMPAIWHIRRSLPDSAIHVMVANHIDCVLKMCPFLDFQEDLDCQKNCEKNLSENCEKNLSENCEKSLEKNCQANLEKHREKDEIIGYQRFPKRQSLWKDFLLIKKLRPRKYDVIINLTGSDRSSLLSLAIYAPIRFGKLFEDKSPWFKRKCFTHISYYLNKKEPFFVQRCKSLLEAGFPYFEPEFNVQIPENVKSRIAREISGLQTFFLLSPFTTSDSRELPESVLSDFINKIDMPFVITCASNEREKSKLKSLLAKLNRQPIKIFDNLDALEFATLISYSKYYLGGSSGGLHLAVALKIPTFSWFHEHSGRLEWQPMGEKDISLIGEQSEKGLLNISADELYKSFLSFYSKIS